MPQFQSNLTYPQSFQMRFDVKEVTTETMERQIEE